MDDLQKFSLGYKTKFVEQLNEAVTNKYARMSILHVEYEVYDLKELGIQEYLVVTYDGGGIAVRNCNCDSCSAIFRELARMIDGGYYDEVNKYYEIKEKYNRILLTVDE